jgi:methionine-rich copper-binding protein CopC
MRPLLLVVGALLVVASSLPARGHAVLTATSLDGKTIRAGTAVAVTLSFNSAIEAGFTRVVLVDERRQERLLDVLPGDAPGRIRVAVPPLAPGIYALRYKVLAADGHVTESVVRFRTAD